MAPDRSGVSIGVQVDQQVYGRTPSGAHLLVVAAFAVSVAQLYKQGAFDRIAHSELRLYQSLWATSCQKGEVELIVTCNAWLCTLTTPFGTGWY